MTRRTYSRERRVSIRPLALLRRAGQIWLAALLLSWAIPVLLSDWSEEARMRAALDAAIAQTASADYLTAEIEAAFAREDIEDVETLNQAALIAGVELPHWVAERYARETTEAAIARRTVKYCVRGLIDGETENGAGLACSVGADFTLIGDLRDLARELPKENPNRLLIGLAAAGVALEAGTLVSLGVVAPAKAAVSTVKAGVRAGRISRGLTRELGALAEGAVDLNRLRRGTLKGAVRAERLEDLLAPMRSLWRVQEKGSLRAARLTLRHADSVDDIRRAEKLALVYGDKAAAALRVLGKGALRTGRIAARLLDRVFGAALSALIGLIEGISFVVWLGAGFGRGVLRLIFGVFLRLG